MLIKYLALGFILLVPTLVYSNDLLTININDTEFSFSKIKGGRFNMGDVNGQEDEQPIRNVKIKSFYLQTTEVTIEQYSNFQTSLKDDLTNGCWYFESGWKYSKKLNWRNPGYQQNKQHPIVCVSWVDIQRFIEHISSVSKHQFRLPSEAEWEYATRANSSTTFYWGSDPKGLCTHANASDLQTLKRFPSFVSNRCDDGFLETAPVGSFKPNPFGLYDVYGNVWEWTQDCWNDSYTSGPHDGSAWLSGDCSRRVFRGGGWGDNPKFARSSLRNRAPSEQRKDDIGFRLVLMPHFSKQY